MTPLGERGWPGSGCNRRIHSNSYSHSFMFLDRSSFSLFYSVANEIKLA